MKVHSIILLLFFFMLLLSCDEEDTISSNNNSLTLLQSATEGNLVILNFTEEELVLYRGGVKIGVLPATSEDFLLYIANPSGIASELEVYRYVDIKENLTNPDNSKIFKRWKVPLHNSMELEHRVTWLIKSDNTEIASGSLTFSYIGGTENSVDIFLNSRTGAKLATLKAGQTNKTVGVDYGNYTLYYRYWYSDPNTPDAETELGWVEKEVVNGNEVPIYLVLNDSRQDVFRQVPHWCSGCLAETLYGNISITNQTSIPLQIWVGSKLVENVMYTDEPIQNMSTIAANESMTYTLLAKETTYSFIAKNLSTTATHSQTNVLIQSDSTYYWKIED